MTKQRSNPTQVGSRKDNPVHFRLPVSFLMVRQVVAQGKWNKKNKQVHRAVVVVQPLATSSWPMPAISSMGTMTPAAV